MPARLERPPPRSTTAVRRPVRSPRRQPPRALLSHYHITPNRAAMSNRFPVAALLAGTAFLAAPAVSQQAQADQKDDPHNQEIVVTGASRAVGDTLGGVSVLSGDLLADELKPSIGETLAS